MGTNFNTSNRCSRITRLARTAAVATAAFMPVAVVAAPAGAATHFTIDRDAIVIDGLTSDNAYRAFQGSMESWHDGEEVRATLTGDYVGRGTLRVSWIFDGGSVSQSTAYSAGAQVPVNLTSPAGTRDVVRFTVAYEPNSSATNHRAESLERYVGDSPESVGSCERLDRDVANISRPGDAKFVGDSTNPDALVTYGCVNGNTTARVTGVLNWTSDAQGSYARVRAVFTYANGTTQSVDNPTAATKARQTVAVSTSSNSGSDLLKVKVVVLRDGSAGPSLLSNLGDG